MPVIACPGGICVGVVAVGNNSESHGPGTETAAGRTGTGNRCQSQAGESCRRGLQKDPPGDNPTLVVEIFAYCAAFLNERYYGPSKNPDVTEDLDL